ncbi:type II secretion system F family protein [Candidatus Nanohalococcus occultus]|uniref:Archaeal flagellar protein FlaJ n=1 Tax=Candidatus Nanohalococcus occultus TaxID=2978047 RepID=A0ABY8CF58_9ARCH|nr:Archaeal flagellar protein FlaJ [Candidatus Nanohaloarchaeota archaeon SVXNc]
MSQIEFFTEEEYEPGRSTEEKVVIGSAIVGAVFGLLGLALYGSSPQLGGSVIILGLLIGVLPYGLLSFLKNRALKEMEDQFPSFLKDLAESKKGGMTIIQAFDSAKETDYGRLNGEVEKIHNQLSWGVPFPKVMERFSKRMSDSSVIQELVSILLQSFKSGGNITKTIESIADDATKLKETIQKKNSMVKQQIAIMYIIYLLFIGITIGLYFMMGQLMGLGSPGEGALGGLDFISGGEGGSTTPSFCGPNLDFSAPMCESAKVFGFVPENITETGFQTEYSQRYGYGNMAYYKSLLFLMLMIQGACTGAVAGQISSGTPSAGVKHALIMLPAAFAIFVTIVGGAGF